MSQAKLPSIASNLRLTANLAACLLAELLQTMIGPRPVWEVVVGGETEMKWKICDAFLTNASG